MTTPRPRNVYGIQRRPLNLLSLPRTLPRNMTALDLSALPVPAQKVLNGTAPAPMRQMAARGIMPGLKPAELVTTIAGLTYDSDSALAQSALESLLKLPVAALDSALESDLQAPVIEVLVQALPRSPATTPSHFARLLRMPQLTESAAVKAASQASEPVGEVIATNETLLLRYPRVIEALYMNKRVRMSTADRIIELAVRHQLALDIPAYRETAQAIQNELIAEPSEEPTYDDLLFRETEQLAQAHQLAVDADTHERDEEGEEQLRPEFKPLYARIASMTITQKIRRAILGTSAERMLLVRETNRLVASAAASSPMLTENEAARIASNRNVIEDVLRIIAQNRSFTRSYQVKLNLVTNPRTPLSFSSRMVPHLRDNDLKAVSRSKNVPANIQTLARQQLMRKQTKR